MALVGLNAVVCETQVLVVGRCLAGDPTAEHSIVPTFKMAIRVPRHAEIRGPVRNP